MVILAVKFTSSNRDISQIMSILSLLMHISNSIHLYFCPSHLYCIVTDIFIFTPLSAYSHLYCRLSCINKCSWTPIVGLRIARISCILGTYLGSHRRCSCCRKLNMESGHNGVLCWMIIPQRMLCNSIISQLYLIITYLFLISYHLSALYTILSISYEMWASPVM